MARRPGPAAFSLSNFDMPYTDFGAGASSSTYGWSWVPSKTKSVL
jgi:hypothetical protein